MTIENTFLANLKKQVDFSFFTSIYFAYNVVVLDSIMILLYAYSNILSLEPNLNVKNELILNYEIIIKIPF